MQLVVDQDQPAGDTEDGLVTAGARRRRLGFAAGDAADGALELVLGHLDDLGGDAGGVGEGEDGGLLTDEQHRAGALSFGVARGTAGGAVVAARGVLADEQAIGFFVADLGAYVCADVEHARHGWLLELGAWAGLFPARKETTGELSPGSRAKPRESNHPPGPGGVLRPRAV